MDNAELLRQLAATAARPLEQALSLPPALYHDQGIHQLEVERIFAHGWICIGRTAEIPRAGDYITRDIVDQSVFVIRQPDGGVKAFPNVCLHRASRLLEGCGHASRISCPYHSWTYDVAGQLVGAPFMQRTADFDPAAYRLAELPIDTWQGFIYINLDRDAQPLSADLLSLGDEIADFDMEHYVHVYEQEEVWDTNWKCLVENFMDVYHLHRVHANSFNRYSSFENDTFFYSGNRAHAWQYIQEDGGEHSVKAHPDNTRLVGDRRFRTYLFNIFPTHVVQLQPDLLWYLSILPKGTGQVQVRWCVSIPAQFLDGATDREAHIRSEVDFLKLVNSEDKPTVESVYRATASRDAQQGPLSWLEQNVWDFGRYLSRQLVD